MTATGEVILFIPGQKLHKLRRRVEKAAGLRVFRALPVGVEFTHDVRTRLRNTEVSVIFDVGANTGDVTGSYLEAFPQSTVFAFEPVSSTFGFLTERYRDYGQVICMQLALGSCEGQAKMTAQSLSKMNHLVDGSEVPDQQFEKVRITTVDRFCEENSIERISLLKVDTEGGDMGVLKGSERMLGAGCIDILYTEVAMNKTNAYHCRLEDIKEYMEGLGYFVFGVYEQSQEWPTGEPHLRRANVAFIASQTIKDNRY